MNNIGFIILKAYYNRGTMERILELIEIRKETHDVKTFRLKLDEKLDFIPGQYCLISFTDEKYPDGKKPFTFATSPTENSYVEFTIKKMGEFTTSLHGLSKGEKLEMDGPRGESLNFDESVDKDVIFITGGSGITPFMSALRYSIDKNLKNKLTLFFSNRTLEDIIYRKELGKLGGKDHIEVIHTLTQKVPDNWEGEEGRIDKEMIKKYVDNLSEKLWYICGPPPMVDAMRELLTELNVPEDNLRIEDWQIPGKHD
ncbi:MAG: oxidoreductase [Candidatus Aenigmarchaeota archaeon]|nr:oxidoreductase [Candidatus Aenigmarchaeota archaeon]